eukprot:CAMPEP_0171523000 /NCGR_PEP_ID=MMETSP0959-20130129/8130_1 /TAXON_ID=87120 /ORGANISM="Aurantiochytrium limacinum, Strain ATCCMYA-1381" /LENGTH=80 /DNA_ID=CAMNT_0012063335 /DNA_START=1267 /DNA_END=1513 /DNA_ORIENTATION=-
MEIDRPGLGIVDPAAMEAAASSARRTARGPHVSRAAAAASAGNACAALRACLLACSLEEGGMEKSAKRSTAARMAKWALL